MKKLSILMLLTLFCSANNSEAQTKKKIVKRLEKIPFVWEGANLYFLMTDRFNKSEKTDEIYFERNKPTGKLRGFEGGNIRGVLQKIDEGYFDKLGTNVIWLTPIVEQIHDGVDEGTGMSYGFHGYWTKDWTAIDPNFGTKKDLADLVEKAHAKGIRIMLDAVINHTGPVTDMDKVWPDDWVRTGPQCDYKTFIGTTECTLVANLPDVLTESQNEVNLPEFLIEKWKQENRYEQEITSLNAFFKRSEHPRTPKFYIIKWLTDYITEFGIDGYRCDTAKHTNEDVWADFKKECDIAFETWKKNNPTKVLDNNPFYTVAEVYNYGISGGQNFDFGDKKVNYFESGFNNMINFEFKWDAQKDYEFLFSKYSSKLNGELKNFSVLNYLSSHDDGQPFDAKRAKSIESGTKLLLSPGISQTYYGDETARSLVVEGTNGDATLRSFMNWEELNNNIDKQNILLHWQKLGRFRRDHASIGAGVHNQIKAKYYTFSRSFSNGKFTDKVVVGLNYPKGNKQIAIGNIFKNGTKVKDAYSGKTSIAIDGRVALNSDFEFVLLEQQK
jgi:alpha-amylase